VGVAQSRRSIGAGHRLEAYATLLLGLADPDRASLKTFRWTVLLLRKRANREPGECAGGGEGWRGGVAEE
jgi:hypothetical protein